MSDEPKLGFWDVFCIASGAMISSGLFVLPGIAFGQAGPAVILSYALAAVLIVPALLCQAELASAMPRTGATYLFIERTLGGFAGTFAGLASWFSIALKSAFALLGIGAFAQLIWPEAPAWIMKVVAVGFCVGFTALNCLTVKGVGRAQIFMVAALLAVLLVFAVGGLGSSAMQLDHFRGFADKGAWRILATAGAVFVSFGGLTATADISGEVRQPHRNVPAGMLAALVVVGLLYVLAVFVTVAVCGPEELTASLTPLSLAAGKFFGTTGVVLLAAAAMLAFVTTANGGILEASRTPVAMSSDRLLPGAFARTSRRFGTPMVSVLVTGGFMVAVLVSLEVEDLVKVASTMLLVLYVLVCVSVVIMRTSRIENYRPKFRVPFVPVLPIAGVVAYLFLIADMGWLPLATTGLFALVGLAWYFFFVRPRSDRQSALVYLVRNVVAREIGRSHLEEELREIALERDAVVHDRFDKVVQRCAILDLEEAIDVELLFARVADELSGPLGLSPVTLKEKLLAREAESHTVIQPGLAIPHVIVPGEGTFEMALVRCAPGVRFSGDDEPVQVVFVLAGSADERNFHLRALMAIAHIVQEPHFADRWLAASHREGLRDLLLLSSRPRES